MQATLVLETLKCCGVTHVVGLPDNSSAALFSLLERDAKVRLVTVSREGEAWAVASGLWIGGATPVVLMQNTGFLESGDGFRGTALRMRIPVLCLITCRGYAKDGKPPAERDASQFEVEWLSRPELDSVAILTEPTLRAWVLPYDFLGDDADLPRIAEALRRADAESRPIALLVTRDMS
jgi:sulfopyruvate decarboxylase TPP-binding subunit